MEKALLEYFWRSGASYQANVSAWLAQGTADGGTPPNATFLNAMSTFMNSLNTAGIGPTSSRMKTLNILFAGSKEFCKLNVKNVATYKYVESGTVTFTAGSGCKSASSSYFDQPFKTDEYANIQTDSTFINYISESSTASGSTKVASGYRTRAGGAYAALTPLSTASAGSILHYSGVALSFGSTNHKGLYVYTRQSGSHVVYKDGVKTTAVQAATAPDISINRYILAYNNATTSGGSTPASFFTHNIALDAILDTFSDADELAFRTAFDTFKTAVSLP